MSKRVFTHGLRTLGESTTSESHWLGVASARAENQQDPRGISELERVVLRVRRRSSRRTFCYEIASKVGDGEQEMIEDAGFEMCELL
jgi:hypothetical protein